MTNPCCSGHPCDDCAVCRAGVCCGTVSAEQRVQLEAALSSGASPQLVALVTDEVSSRHSLVELVRQDAALGPALPHLPHPSVLSLPAAPTDNLPVNSRKEVPHGLARAV